MIILQKSLRQNTSYLCIFFLGVFSSHLASTIEIGLANKHLDADYDFLPAQDSSFEHSSIDEFNILINEIHKTHQGFLSSLDNVET